MHLFIGRVIKRSAAITAAYHCYQLHKTVFNILCQSQIHAKTKLLGIINVGLDATGQLLIIRCALEKKWEYNGTVHQ